MTVASSDGPLAATPVSVPSSANGLSLLAQEKVLKSVFTLPNGTGLDHGSPEHASDHFRNSSGSKNGTGPSNHNVNGTSIAENAGQMSDSRAGSTHSLASIKSRPVENGRLSTQGDRRQRTPANDALLNGHKSRLSNELISSEKQTSTGRPSQDVFSTNNPSSEIFGSSSPPSGYSPHVPAKERSNSFNRHSLPSPTSSPVGPDTSPASIPRLIHRHTLQMPKVSGTSSRRSRDFSINIRNSEDAISATGRISPSAADGSRIRRASTNLVRRATKPPPADGHLDDYPPDEDAMRWTEAIRQKRASKRRRREDDDDDRVMVGTKVDQGHVNWVTAYNMLTGIRFTVSRTNAKIDRELTEADFVTRQKFSFDVTGNELTPSAKYDFKFKDYSPWVFRRLRTIFGLDPADYLVSLTSKYILSELGSPGKSGSFFYFSRDYKYIIKTIHPAEHRLLRRVLREYYKHVLDNPNTLLSQFYGLHRVKIPYGRKIHFVVMNNLFPPHRDIHQMFDLKGSTIGRDYPEEELEKHPRATLKDLNWLRRNKQLELGPGKREVVLEQMKKDVALLQRLKIMDYSMLIGIHDLGQGNEQNLRQHMLKVFQPGGEKSEDDTTAVTLSRTSTRHDNARKARELRQKLKREKPVPLEMMEARMPDELPDNRTDRIFHSDDGGFQAIHDNGEPGDVIYYLGIIDCLTHVSPLMLHRYVATDVLTPWAVWLHQTPRALLEGPFIP